MDATVTKILLVDDDRELCASLQRLLRMDGFTVTAVHDANRGIEAATGRSHELVVLDVMLPGGDGRTVLRKVRAVSDVPIIMLTARGNESDRIAGLEAGADDYLPKPFNPRELVARIRAVLKRRAPGPSKIGKIILGDLEIHPTSRRAIQTGEEVSLTGAEFDILLLLVRAAGRVLSRDEIAEACLGRPVSAFDRSIDNHISNLRKKLGGPDRIRSVRGSGYVYPGAEAE